MRRTEAESGGRSAGGSSRSGRLRTKRISPSAVATCFSQRPASRSASVVAASAAKNPSKKASCPESGRWMPSSSTNATTGKRPSPTQGSPSTLPELEVHRRRLPRRLEPDQPDAQFVERVPHAAASSSSKSPSPRVRQELFAIGKERELGRELSPVWVMTTKPSAASASGASIRIRSSPFRWRHPAAARKPSAARARAARRSTVTPAPVRKPGRVSGSSSARRRGISSRISRSSGSSHRTSTSTPCGASRASNAAPHAASVTWTRAGRDRHFQAPREMTASRRSGISSSVPGAEPATSPVSQLTHKAIHARQGFPPRRRTHAGRRTAPTCQVSNGRCPDTGKTFPPVSAIPAPFSWTAWPTKRERMLRKSGTGGEGNLLNRCRSGPRGIPRETPPRRTPPSLPTAPRAPRSSRRSAGRPRAP